MPRKRITVDLEPDLLTALDAGAAETRRSRNQFIADAVRRLLGHLERRRVDAEFEAMADDPEYLAELQRIDAEMSGASDSSWAILERAERRAGAPWVDPAGPT